MANNLLVDWLNNKKKNVQTNVLRKSATNTNNVTTPNLPIKPTTVSQTGLNLQKAQQPVQTRLNNINTQTAPTQTNTGVGSIAQTPNQSRFIGFQQQQPQAKSFNKLMNNEYLMIPTAVNQANFANAKEENRYRTAEQVIKDFAWDVKNSNGNLTREDISKYYKEWEGNEDAALQLQVDILPLVQQGQFPDMNWVSQTYGELLKGKELKDVEKIKENIDINNKKLQQIQTNIDKTLKTNWQSLSPNGMKYIQNWNTVLKTLDEAKKQGVVGGASNVEIIDYLAKNNPEFNNIFKELNGLELSEMDKAIVGKKDASLLKQVQNKMSQFLIDQVTNSKKPTDEEIESVMRGKEKLENDFWGQTGKKIATEIGVPVDSLEKLIYRTYKDIQNEILEKGSDFSKDYIVKELKSAFNESLGIDLTDEQADTVKNMYDKIVTPSIQEKIKTNKQNVIDYTESVNKEYESRKARNLDPDIENYVNNMGMTRSLLQGNLEAFGYKSAGDMAQNADMLVTTALGVVAPEVVLPLMAVDSYSRESQESFEELMETQKKMGIPQDEAYDNAQKGSVIVGLASATVELALEKLIGGVETTASKAWHDAFTKEFTKKATEMMTERGLADILKQGATTQFKASLEEGLEEVLQQTIHNKAVQQYDPDQKLTEGLLQAFEGGFYNPMNLLAGGGDVFSNIDTNSIKQGVNNTVDNATARARNIVNNVKNVTSRIEPAPGKIGEVFDSMRNKVTSQGGTNNTQQQGQQTQLNTASENQNNINQNQDNKTEKENKPGIIDRITERGAEKITSTVKPQDKLYKAQQPRMESLTKKKDLEKRRANSDRANELIVQNGYKPTNTEERVIAHQSTLDKLWKVIKDRITDKAGLTVDQTSMINELEEYIKSKKDLGVAAVESDIKQLEKELKLIKESQNKGNVDLPLLEGRKQVYNDIIERKQQEASDVYLGGLRLLTSAIGKIEDEILAKVPGEFSAQKRDVGALIDSYEDVFKAHMKQQRSRGIPLTETYSRIEGLSDIANGVIGAVSGKGDLGKVAQGAAKLLVGKSLAKAKDVDFLIKTGFEELSKTVKPSETQGTNGTENNSTTTPPTTPPTTPTVATQTSKNKVTSKKKSNKKSNSNKKSDSSSSDDGGTPTGGTPAGTNPTNNQGGTTDDTKIKKQPKKKTETKTKTTSKKSAVTDYINETPQNERGQLEEIETEENLRNNETPQRDMVEEAPENKVTSKKAEATAPKQEENQTSEHFSYKDYGEFMKKYEAAEKEINDRLDKQMDKERAEKMERFNELTKKEDKTDAEGDEMMKLAGELNNMSNRYDRLKEEEFNKKHPELVAEKQRQNEMFDRDWKAAMDKKMEEINKPFNNLRDKYLKELRDELGIADDVTLDSDFYNSLTPEQKKIADEINKEYAEKYEELRQKTASIKKIEEESKTKITGNKKNKVTNPSKVKESGLFNENEVDKGNKSEGLNPDALPLSDYREMQRLNDGYSLTSLSSALSKESLKDYMANKIANEKIGVKPDFDDNEAWDNLPEDFEDNWETVASDIEDMYDAYEEYSDMKNDGDFDENTLKNTLESANDYANRQFPGKTAKEVIDQYTPEYESDLKVYNRLIKKYPSVFANGKIDLTGAEGKARREFANQENETAQDIDYQELAERENETAQIPTIFEEDLEQMNLRELDENETPQTVEEEKTKNLVTSEQQSEFETLPDDVTVSQEAKQLGAKRIAPDRVPRQQLTFDEGVNKIAENLETLAEYKKTRDELYSPDGYNDGEVYVRYNNLKKEFQNIMYGNNGFQFKSNKSKEFTDLWKNIVDNKDNKTALREVAKNFYISKVKKDISKGYVYPQEVIDKIPGAKKAIDNRERYEKGLNTSFSAKDERIDYSEKDKIGAGMKSQDGKQITKEQKEDIVKGILDFGKTLGLDMKKFAEDRGLVYVHLHGGLAFLNNMAAGLYRESTNEQGEKNISVSVGGAENVRYKDPKTKERKTTTLNTTMSHELGHAMDYLLDNKLFSWTQKSILGSKYNPVNRLRKYYAKGNEIVARAIEQYVAVENGQPNYYLENGNLDAGEFKGTDLEYALKEVGSYYERPGYWSKPDYEKYVKPYVEEAFKNNFEEYKINKSQKNVLGNDKNKVTTQAARAYSPTIVMRFDENGNPVKKNDKNLISNKKNKVTTNAEAIRNPIITATPPVKIGDFEIKSNTNTRAESYINQYHPNTPGADVIEQIDYLNSNVRGKGRKGTKRTKEDRIGYRIKDDIILDDIIGKGIKIKDRGKENTGYKLKSSSGKWIEWHVGDRVYAILQKKGLLI